MEQKTGDKMGEFLKIVGIVTLFLLFLAAIIIPFAAFVCTDYAVVIEADANEIGQLSLTTGDNAKVWIKDYGKLGGTAHWLIVNARDFGGLNDITAWLNGYDYIIFELDD